jgi:hypothetical protein
MILRDAIHAILGSLAAIAVAFFIVFALHWALISLRPDLDANGLPVELRGRIR